MKIIDLNYTIKPLEKDFDLAIVMPMYNEADNIKIVLSDWNQTFVSLKLNVVFVLVNDGSTDNTIKVIEDISELNIVLLNKRNSGHGRSIRLGYDYTIDCIDTDYVLQIDSDGQCNPNYFKSFWDIRANYDFLIGSRISRGDGLIRLLTSRISTLLSSIVVRKNLYDANTPYRLMRKKALKDIIEHIRPSFDIHNIAVTYVAYWLKLRIKRIDISFPERAGGENSINVRSVYHLGTNMLFELSKLSKTLKKMD